MNLQQARRSLKFTMQAAGDAVGITREAVRLAEAGKAPKAAVKLETHYRSLIRQREIKLKGTTMARKKSKIAPIDLEFHIALDDSDGGIIISYSGTDPRTYATGDAIIDAICKANHFRVEEIFKGDVRA